MIVNSTRFFGLVIRVKPTPCDGPVGILQGLRFDVVTRDRRAGKNWGSLVFFAVFVPVRVFLALALLVVGRTHAFFLFVVLCDQNTSYGSCRCPANNPESLARQGMTAAVPYISDKLSDTDLRKSGQSQMGASQARTSSRIAGTKCRVSICASHTRR